MTAGYQALSEKEKQTLRLMVRGHDAKSLAKHLNLSVHTVNERLRDARRKLQVSSSREAARLVFEAERTDPQNLADDELGEAGAPAIMRHAATMETGQGRRRSATWITGAVIVSIIAGLFALSLAAVEAPPSLAQVEPPASPVAAPTATNESEVVSAARDWLVLHDQRRWKDTWEGTATSFRESNTLERWSKIAEQVRVPLGELISRTALSQDSVPAPPAGVEVVKFRTSFANKTDAVETISLAREGADWKVVGIYIE